MRISLPARGRLMGAVLLAAFLAVGLGSVSADDGKWETIFDGKTLKNWDGNPKFWRVEDGAITGQTTPDNPTKGNTFIIWRGGKLKDFELELEYKIIKGNSGIQYRSFEVPKQKWVIGGYQGDFEAGKTYSGILYGEKFRGILCNRGQKTELFRDDDGKFTKEGCRLGRRFRRDPIQDQARRLEQVPDCRQRLSFPALHQRSGDRGMHRQRRKGTPQRRAARRCNCTKDRR